MQIEIVDNSRQVRREMEAACLRVLEKCGLAAEGYAKQLCAVDTGNLRNSITHQVQSSELVCYIGTNNEYAVYVELGTGIHYPGGRQTPWVYQDARGNWHITRGQRAQPYLKPAIAGHVTEYQRIIRTGLSNG